MNHESVESGRICVFEGDQHHNKNPLSLDQVLPRITRLYYSAMFKLYTDAKSGEVFLLQEGIIN